MPQTNIKPGTRVRYQDDYARREGVVIAQGGEYLLGVFGVVHTDRTPEGAFDRVERLELANPIAVPVADVEVIA